jgi:ABC-type multidrug transport system fused ATPase/permease subunit
VLDEATSALDGITETAVQARLRALRGQCTVLLVAHRPSTVAVADHVVLLDDGLVAEQGGFRELLDGPGALSRLLLGGLPE